MAYSLDPILQTFDLYVTYLESPSIYKNATSEQIMNIFQCCQFVEAAVMRARQEGKVEALESHLNWFWRLKNRSNKYPLTTLERATDRMLEMFLKTPDISTTIIDTILLHYVGQCGRERLELFVHHVLTSSWSVNALVDTLIKSGLAPTTINNEAQIIVWDADAAAGRLDQVYQSIDKMIEDGHIKKILHAVSVLGKDSPAKKLIIKNISKRTCDCDVPICLELSNVPIKLLKELLEDSELQINMLDMVFYFGRNMTWNGRIWKSDNGFTYQHLLRMMKNLLSISSEIREIINTRLEFVKTQMDGAIWIKLEGDLLPEADNSD